MTNKEIHDLIKLVNRLDLTEFKMRDGEFEVSIRTKHYGKQSKSEAVSQVPVVAAPIPQMSVAAPTVEAPVAATPQEEVLAARGGSESADEANLVEVKSPIVGTFYRSASPDKPPYIKVGDAIEVGSVVCIVEAMKLFNEIESEVSGKIVKVLVEDASPVEYDQPLFLVDPKG